MKQLLHEIIADIRFAQANPELLLVLIAFVWCIGVSACKALPDPTTGQRNACLPEAIMMKEALTEKGVKSNVVLIETPSFNHAICSYQYPAGENKLWGWDSMWKSVRLRAWVDDHDSIARAWLRKTHPSVSLVRSDFL